MARHVKVSTIGTVCPDGDWDTTPESIERTIQFLQQELDQVLPERPDLIVLPERCYVPHMFVQSPERRNDLLAFLAATEDHVQRFIADVAKQHQCYIAYPSYRRFENDRRANTIFLFDRSGSICGTYDKVRPTVGELDAGVIPGNEAVVLPCDFGTVGLAVCFDLNFEELLQQYAKKNPDLIVFSSMYHGGLMQERWAYACRSHFVGAIGPSELPSEIRLPTGTVAATSTNYFNHVTSTINLDCQLIHLDCLFGCLNELKTYYGTQVKIFDPGLLGSVLVSAETNDLSVHDVMAKFDLPSLDEYLETSRRACGTASLGG